MGIALDALKQHNGLTVNRNCSGEGFRVWASKLKPDTSSPRKLYGSNVKGPQPINPHPNPYGVFNYRRGRGPVGTGFRF